MTKRFHLQAKLRADLRPSYLLISSKVSLALGIGVTVMTLMCRLQSSDSLTMFAHGILSHQMSGVECLICCATLFAVIPVIALRLMCTGVQFHYLLRNRLLLLGIWVSGANALILAHDRRLLDLSSSAIWVLSVIAAFFVIAKMVVWLDRSRFNHWWQFARR